MNPSSILPFAATVFLCALPSSAQQQEDRSINILNHINNGQAFLISRSGNQTVQNERPDNAGMQVNAPDIVFWLGPPSYLGDVGDDGEVGVVNSIASHAVMWIDDHEGLEERGGSVAKMAAMGYAAIYDETGGYYSAILADFDDFTSYQFNEYGNPAVSTVFWELSGKDNPHGLAGVSEQEWAGLDDPVVQDLQAAVGMNLTSEVFESVYAEVYAAHHGGEPDVAADNSTAIDSGTAGSGDGPTAIPANDGSCPDADKFPCTKVVQPVVCGEAECAYQNLCFGTSGAGFDPEDCQLNMSAGYATLCWFTSLVVGLASCLMLLN